MKRLLWIGLIAIVVAGVGYVLRIELRDKGLDTVAALLGERWSARFRNVSKHVADNRPWLCGEVSRPGSDGFERFVVAAGTDMPVIEEHNPDTLRWAWQRYCT